MTTFVLFFRQCIRSKEVWISLLLITLLGILSIVIGNKHIETQQDAITEVKSYQEQHFDRQVVIVLCKICLYQNLKSVGWIIDWPGRYKS